MKEITIYTLKNCPNCEMLKTLLKKENIEFKQLSMNTPQAMTELSTNNVFTMSAPVLQIDNKFYTTKELLTNGIIDKNILKNLT